MAGALPVEMTDPELIIPPVKVETVLTLMPSARLESVPAFEMPPPNVDVLLISMAFMKLVGLTLLLASVLMPPAIVPVSRIWPVMVLLVTLMPPGLIVPVLQTFPVNEVLLTAILVTVTALLMWQRSACAWVAAPAISDTSELVANSRRNSAALPHGRPVQSFFIAPPKPDTRLNIGIATRPPSLLFCRRA